MQSYTPRELALQNLLAVGSILLFRSAQAMRSGDIRTQATLVIECETWFSETRLSLSALISEEARVTFGPVRSAATLGENWKAPPDSGGSSPASDAISTNLPSSEGDHSSRASPGADTMPPKTSRKPSTNPLSYFLGTKP